MMILDNSAAVSKILYSTIARAEYPSDQWLENGGEDIRQYELMTVDEK